MSLINVECRNWAILCSKYICDLWPSKACYCLITLINLVSSQFCNSRHWFNRKLSWRITNINELYDHPHFCGVKWLGVPWWSGAHAGSFQTQRDRGRQAQGVISPQDEPQKSYFDAFSYKTKTTAQPLWLYKQPNFVNFVSLLPPSLAKPLPISSPFL